MNRIIIAAVFLLVSLGCSAQIINRVPETIFTGKASFGNVGLNNNSTDSWLTIGDSATTKALTLPRVQTTSAVANPRQGMVVYSISDSTLYLRDRQAWKKVGSNIYNSDGSLTGNRQVNTNGYNLIFSSNGNSPTIRSNATTGRAGIFTSAEDYGIVAESYNYVAGLFAVEPSSTNTIQEILRLSRATQGTAADGIGAAINIINSVSSGSAYTSNQIISKWTNATDASRTSSFVISGVNSGTTADKLTVNGNGLLTINDGPLNFKPFTPASSTDATHPNGTLSADDSFIYFRKSNGDWVKIAWTSF